MADFSISGLSKILRPPISPFLDWGGRVGQITGHPGFVGLSED